MIDKNLTFIIPAAGKSSRFKSNQSKIFYKYKNKPLIMHVVEKCLEHSNKIVIVINAKNKKNLKKILSVYKKINFIYVFQNKAKGMGHAISLGLLGADLSYASIYRKNSIALSYL